MYINGVMYELEFIEAGEKAENVLMEMKYSDTDYIQEFGKIEDEMSQLEKSFDENLFIAKNEVMTSQTEIIKLRKQLEWMKVDYMKLERL